MHPEWTLEQIFWLVSLISRALVAGRLYTLSLHRKYIFFFIGLLVGLARTGVLFPFHPNTKRYMLVWAWTQAIIWTFRILTVFELRSLVLMHYPGIASASRRFLQIAVPLSALIAAATVLPTISVAAGRNRFFYIFTSLERGIASSLGLFLIMLMAFVAWFAVPLSRNLLYHCTIYTTYFLVDNMSFLYAMQSKEAVRTASTVLIVLGIGCYLAWTFMLTKAGEERTTSLLLGRSTAQEQNLLRQLDHLNATLVRVNRK